MPDVDEAVPAFLKKEIRFANGQTYMLQRALNDYRSCHDGTPQEARIVFICTLVDDSSSKKDFIMKIKVQSVSRSLQTSHLFANLPEDCQQLIKHRTKGQAQPQPKSLRLSEYFETPKLHLRRN
jgi:hypothetical protein